MKKIQMVALMTLTATNDRKQVERGATFSAGEQEARDLQPDRAKLAKDTKASNSAKDK